MDARNHGDSPHVDEMTYQLMAGDLAELVQDLNLGRVSLAGHSMGGRTVMMAALTNLVEVDKLIVLDISPINQKFDVTSSNEWNMEHFFHCLKVNLVVININMYNIIFPNSGCEFQPVHDSISGTEGCRLPAECEDQRRRTESLASDEHEAGSKNQGDWLENQH